MSASPSVRDRFHALVAALRAHPDVVVLAAEIRPGASEGQMAEAESEIGIRLPEAMRAFYAEQNGIFLEWGLRGVTYEYPTRPFDYPDYGQPPGCINLLPVAQALSVGWEADSHVNEIQPAHWKALYGAVPDPLPVVGSICFDNFRKYNHADLILGPEPVVVVSTDHGADMDSSDYTDFGNYLEATLRLYGADRYAHAFGIGWSRRSARAPVWTRRPSLDEIVALVRAEEG